MKSVIFDLDGTLVESMDFINNMSRDYLIENDLKPEAGLKDKLFTMTFDEGAKYFAENYDIKKDAEQIKKELNEKLEKFYKEEVNLKSNAKELLKELNDKEIPMIIITSTERVFVESALEKNDIQKYFKRIFTVDEVGKSKGEKLIYQKALEFLACEPENIWFFDDGLYAIEAASKLGIKTVGVFDNQDEETLNKMKETADIFVNDLGEFNKF